MAGFNGYVTAMIEERRARRSDDLLSALIDAQEAGDRLSPAELVAMVVQLIFAGHETTQNLLGNGMFRLLQHPDQLALLRAASGADSLRPSRRCCATTRRSRSPRASPRRDTEIDGIPVEADQLVMLNLTAGNHDPARFPDRPLRRDAP